MERIYHPYTAWEDYHAGMYESTCYMDPERLIVECASMLSCPQWLEESMRFVLIQWEKACEHHLTNTHRNRQAWLGQSACCLILGAPENITKQAWNRLTPQQQKEANDVADFCIKMFEEKMEIRWQKLN